MGSLTIYNKQHNGFSLIEMAIVLLITGILMGAGLSLLAVKQNAAQINLTQTHQEAIKQALINYLGQYKRLPCPATTVAAGGIEDRSGSPCKQYSGIIPYATLGLDRSAALDGWENFIDYVVSPTSSATPPYNAWLYTYGTTGSTTVTTNPILAFWPSNTAGSLNVIGNSTLSGIVAALISHGKNGYGAFNTKGGKNDSSAAGTDELQNINPILGTPANTVVKRDITDSTAGGGAFDDIVSILGANDLIGPLIANGTLQSSPQSAINQANNIVLGRIIATRGSCSPCSFTVPSTASFYSGGFSFPSSVAAWGVTYAASGMNFDYTDSGTSTVYTLTAGDGTSRAVSRSELNGILAQGVGF